jgi:hypothetical protein
MDSERYQADHHPLPLPDLNVHAFPDYGIISLTLGLASFLYKQANHFLILCIILQREF